MSRAPVVVAGFDARASAATDELAGLLEVLARRGVDAETVLVGDGELLPALRRSTPVTVLDEMRRRGPGRIALLAGQGALASSIKGARVRHWAHQRSGAALVVHDPTALVLVERGLRPSRVVVTPAATDGPGAAGLVTALGRFDVLWTARDAAQAERLRDLGTGPVPVVGDLALTRSARPLLRAPADRPVVALVPPAPAWSAIAHTVELVWQLGRQRPATRFTWLARSEEDRWLAHHDLARTGVASRVRVVDLEAWHRHPATVVVRSGYGAERSGALESAACGGVPVVGFDVDLPGAVAAPPPFAVEQLVAEVVALLDDPARGRELGRRLEAGTRARIDPGTRLAPVLAVLGSG